MDRTPFVLHIPTDPTKALPSLSSIGYPKPEESARMHILWTAAGQILGSSNRLWASNWFVDFRDGKVSPIDAAMANEEGLAESLAYLERSRERLLDWGWTGGPTPWRTRPKSRGKQTWKWTKRPPPP